MTTVSTIIPAYNSAGFLREAIDSALAQTYEDQEIIVIDDGSTDATPDLLASYGEQIRWIRQPNGGQVVARNHGASLATGEWLAFLDSDDLWLPQKLERQLAAVGDAALVYTSRVNFGDVERVSLQQTDGTDLWDGDVFDRLLEGNFITLSSAMIRRDWFERLGGFAEPRGCEDWDLWLKLAAAGGLVALVREPLTRYRWQDDSTSGNHAMMNRARLKVVERALATIRGSNLSRTQANRVRASAWTVSAWRAAGTEFWKPIFWYFKAAQYSPWDRTIYKNMLKCLLRRA